MAKVQEAKEITLRFSRRPHLALCLTGEESDERIAIGRLAASGCWAARSTEYPKHNYACLLPISASS